MVLITKLRELWKRFTCEPTNLDKAIKNNSKTARIRYLFSAIFFVIGVFVLVGFALPILQAISLADVTAYERLAAISGVCILVVVPFAVGTWEYIMGLSDDQTALHYRLRKLEKRFETEAA